MTQRKHTPLPWIARQTYHKGESQEWVVSSGARFVCTPEGLNEEEQEANAEFIALACNSYATLLDDLERLSQLVERMNNAQHAGIEIDPLDWSDAYQLTAKTKADIHRARRPHDRV